MEKRELAQTEKKGINLQDLLLTAVLLAAGAVLKFFVGAFINIAGMKPNFVIAMYCMAIALIRPKFYYSLIIGILALISRLSNKSSIHKIGETLPLTINL